MENVLRKKNNWLIIIFEHLRPSRVQYTRRKKSAKSRSIITIAKKLPDDVQTGIATPLTRPIKRKHTKMQIKNFCKESKKIFSQAN